jgi:predicted HicB family RNase H-like nuclease
VNSGCGVGSRAQVFELLESNPGISVQQIAERLGITRERVYEILSKNARCDLRLAPELHKRVYQEAKNNECSLNAEITFRLNQAYGLC